MSKELEAFNKLMEESPEVHIESYETVKKALQRLESIDNAKPSEALECLESGKKVMWAYDYDTIKQTLLKAQEQEKENAELKRVLEIINKKCVDIGYLKWCLNEYEGDMALIVYNGHQNIVKAYELTKEEFDLLKRYLG